MRLYLAGPMTGLPRFNFPAFDEAAERLREEGHDVVSPAELDSAEFRAHALASPDGCLDAFADTTGETWGDFLARDVKLLADGGLDAVIVLPGWEQSRGARLETFVATLCGLGVYRMSERHRGVILPVHRGELVAAWAGNGARAFLTGVAL